MSQEFHERYSDLNEGQKPSKETDQRRIAELIIKKNIPIDQFPFKREGDNPDEMRAGIRKYAAGVFDFQITPPVKEVEEGDGQAEPINYIDNDCDEPQDVDQSEAETEEKREEGEKQSLTGVPFAELARLLAPKGMVLRKQLDDHVQFMLNSGAILEQDAELYREKFETIYVRKEELNNIPQDWRPMLFVDDMTPVQAGKTFITDQGIYLKEWIDLSEFRKVNQKTKEPYRNQIPSGLARLTFTPDITSLTRDLTGKNADYHLEQMKKGMRYLQPQQWFQLFAENLQKAMKELGLGNGKALKDMTLEEKQKIINDTRIDQYLPDAVTWTQCPDWRDPAGGVLRLRWHPGFRGVGVDDGHPQRADGGLGPRPVLS